MRTFLDTRSPGRPLGPAALGVARTRVFDAHAEAERGQSAASAPFAGRDFASVRLHSSDARAERAAAGAAAERVMSGGSRTLAVSGLTSVTGPIVQRAPAPQAARRTDPAACLEGACTEATRLPAPTSDADARGRVDVWERKALACVNAAAADSDATHAGEIGANETNEIAAAAAQLRAITLPQLGHGRRRYLDFLQSLGETCVRKSAEVGIEFRHDVIFDTPASATSPWGYGDATWDRVEGALSALPADATRGGARAITFHRADCHPRDRDAAGNCVGQGSGAIKTFVGGETDAATREITVFDHGLGDQPYARSSALRLSATDQTLRHEVGHVIEAQISKAARDHFFADLVGWNQYAWAWIANPKPPYKEWRAERERLMTELGFDDTKLDAWLTALQTGKPVLQGTRRYVRDTNGLLQSIDAARLPKGPEFEYALTNQGEYLAELYALAVSRPQFLHDALPAEQIGWLKREVFHTPATADEWARRLALNTGADRGALLARLARVFTWEQADQVFADRPDIRGGRVA